MTEERVEHLLAEVQDEFGVIRVLEVADYRFLEFGDAIEQSCVFTAIRAGSSTTIPGRC